MRRPAVRLAVIATIAVAALANAVSGQRLDRLERSAGSAKAGRELLYLPNGKHLRVASLGQASMLADVVYLWAIQYYANYERADRYRYVEHVFGNVIAELDPHFIDAYWLGALILTVEAGDLDAGLRLLDRGFENNPESWVLPYLAGWECYHARDLERARAYFARAAAVPGAPPLVRRLIAGLAGRTGNPREALALWQRLLGDPASDSATRAIAERQVRDLRVRADLADLTQAIRRFRNENRRLPAGLEELLRGGYVSSLPSDPDGRAYSYDARSGRVSSPASRVLRDS